MEVLGNLMIDFYQLNRSESGVCKLKFALTQTTDTHHPFLLGVGKIRYLNKWPHRDMVVRGGISLQDLKITDSLLSIIGGCEKNLLALRK